MYADTPITWRTTVTNTGNGPLSGVSVDDSLLAPADDPAYVSGDSDADGKLDTAETWIFEATGAAAIGPYANTATVTATGAAGEPMSANDTSGYTGAKRPVVTESEVCGQPFDQYGPAVSGQRVVWEDRRDNTQSDIYGWDFGLPGEMVVNVPGSDQNTPSISGSRVVWVDRRNDVAGDIYSYDFAPPGTNFIVCDASDSQTDPAIDGDLVVWADHRGAAWDVYGRDLSKPLDPEFVIAAAVSTESSPPSDLAVSGTMVIWKVASGVYGCDLAVTPYAPFLITDNGIGPAISGDVVVFGRYAAGTGWDIWRVDLGTHTEYPVCQAAGDQEDPAVAATSSSGWTDAPAAPNSTSAATRSTRDSSSRSARPSAATRPRRRSTAAGSPGATIATTQSTATSGGRRWSSEGRRRARPEGMDSEPDGPGRTADPGCRAGAGSDDPAPAPPRVRGQRSPRSSGPAPNANGPPPLPCEDRRIPPRRLPPSPVPT